MAKALHESQIETTATGTDNVASRYLGALRMTLEASLSTVNDDAFVLLSICSFLDPDTIPFSLLDLYPWANPGKDFLPQHKIHVIDRGVKLDWQISEKTQEYSHNIRLSYMMPLKTVSPCIDMS